MGFTNSNNDPCLFSRRWDDGSVILIGIYVDDIVCAHKGSKFDWFKREFTGPTGFRASHLGPLSWFLGISINQDDDFTVKCTQDQYVSKLLEKFVPVLPTSLIKHSMPAMNLHLTASLQPRTTKSVRRLRLYHIYNS